MKQLPDTLLCSFKDRVFVSSRPSVRLDVTVPKPTYPTLGTYTKCCQFLSVSLSISYPNVYYPEPVLFWFTMTYVQTIEVKVKGKGKKGQAVPLQAWGGPECSRNLGFPDFMTTAQDGGKIVSLTHRPPLPQEIHLVLISVRGWFDLIP